MKNIKSLFAVLLVMPCIMLFPGCWWDKPTKLTVSAGEYKITTMTIDGEAVPFNNTAQFQAFLLTLYTDGELIEIAEDKYDYILEEVTDEVFSQPNPSGILGNLKNVIMNLVKKQFPEFDFAQITTKAQFALELGKKYVLEEYTPQDVLKHFEMPTSVSISSTNLSLNMDTAISVATTLTAAFNLDSATGALELLGTLPPEMQAMLVDMAITYTVNQITISGMSAQGLLTMVYKM